MSESEEILGLLEQCEELRRQGKTFEESIDQVCSAYPDRKEEVARYLRRMEWAGQFFGLEHGAMAATGKEGHDTPLPPEVELPPPEKVGRYQLDLLLGSGGFGRVWRAYDPKLQRRVAIKIARPGRLLSTGAMEAMLDEARKAASLVHPGIVAVHDADNDGPYCYIVSDLVEGTNLAEHISQGSFSFNESARIAGTVAEALHYAHGKGIAHLDIKPKNILLDTEGHPHVADFGLARKESAGPLPGPEDFMAGTPGYMSPEQALGQSHRAGALSDVYSLGVVLFELLTRERPFRGQPHMVLQQTIEDDPPSPRRLDATVPADLETICLKCLEKEPERRYRTAQELAEELARFRRGEPILARPISRMERAWRWCRRNPLPAALLGTVALLLLALTTATCLWATRETALRRLAEDERGRAQEAEAKAKDAEAQALRALAQSGMLASQRGKWREALKFFDEALESGHLDPIGVRLERLKVLRAGAGPGEILKEIQLLSSRDDLGKHQAEVLLWQAVVLWGQNKDQEAIALIEKALALGLPPAEASWARSLIAPTFPEAVAHNRAALRGDPFHYPAMIDLCGSLFFMGRRGEAQVLGATGSLLFPQDPNFPTILALCAALDGNREEAEHFQKVACLQLDKSGSEILRAGVTLAAEARTYDFIDSSPDEEAKLFAPLGQLFMKMQERQEEIEKANSKPRDQARRPLEILLLGRAAREITGLFRIVAMPSKSKKEKLAALEKAVQINPEGTIQFLLAGLLLDEDKLEEAEKAFRNAATTPALIPSVNRRGYYGASVAAISLFRSHGRNLEDGKRTAGYIRKYFQAGMIAPSKDAQGLFPMAALTGEWDLAGQLVGEGLREKPDNLELVRWRARIDSKNGDYFSAIKATDELLRLKPGDAEMQSLRKETLQKLGDWLAQKRSG